MPLTRLTQLQASNGPRLLRSGPRLLRHLHQITGPRLLKVKGPRLLRKLHQSTKQDNAISTEAYGAHPYRPSSERFVAKKSPLLNGNGITLSLALASTFLGMGIAVRSRLEKDSVSGRDQYAEWQRGAGLPHFTSV